MLLAIVLGMVPELAAASARAGACLDTIGPPRPAMLAGAVWTGQEMLVFGGEDDRGATNAAFGYDLARHRWRELPPAPIAGRMYHSVIWTGSAMIAWGGNALSLDFDDGALYLPASDSWRPLSASGLAGRRDHSAVWTGARMIVWGGQSGSVTQGVFHRSGSSYDPVGDVWSFIDGVGAPNRRSRHTAAWTGSEMVIVGGGTDVYREDTGGRYDPATDSWRATSTVGAPRLAKGYRGAWNGSVVVVWDGTVGGRYDPAGDVWQPVAATGSINPKWGSAVAAGSDVLFWYDGAGARYDPGLDQWSPLPAASDAISGRSVPAAVWTGAEMILWGGNDGTIQNDGARYAPSAGTWTRLPTGNGAPTARYGHTATWTSTEVVLWGGSGRGGPTASGARYDPVARSWARTASSTGCPARRSGHTAVWSGSEVLIWGAPAGNWIPDGAAYDPASDTWRPMSTSGAPAARNRHRAVWTGSEMLIWGGQGPVNYLGDGGAYDPVLDRWRTIATSGAPTARVEPSTIWTGSEMVVWGGNGAGYLGDGARYEPVGDRWLAMTGVGAPSPRLWSTAVWTGTEMIVFGGRDAYSTLSDGGRYAPASDIWKPLGAAGAPSARSLAHAVWTGTTMIVWGGFNGNRPLGTGARYDPVSDGWQSMTTVGAAEARYAGTAVWTGTEMFVWGGSGVTALYLWSGAIYDPANDAWSPGCTPPLGDLLLVGKTKAALSPEARLDCLRLDGTTALTIPDTFPGPGGGVRPAAGDVDRGGVHEILAATGPNPAIPPRVRGFDATGTLLPGLDFVPYGATGYGAFVAAGAIDAGDEILTGPGPSPAYGPHVRAFRYVLPIVYPIPAVSFYAYATLRHGVNVASGDVDADGFDEILTGAGAGAVFGPHVRGFDYDAVAVVPKPAINFYAYQTLAYGVELGSGDVDGDGYEELLTGPGPSGAFLAHLRGWDADGGPAAPLPGASAIVFSGSTHGLNVTAGDLDRDGDEEIGCGAGPDPLFGSRVKALAYGASRLTPIPALDLDVFGQRYGARVASGNLGL